MFVQVLGVTGSHQLRVIVFSVFQFLWLRNQQGLVPLLQGGVPQSWGHAAVQDLWSEASEGGSRMEEYMEQVWARE